MYLLALETDVIVVDVVTVVGVVTEVVASCKQLFHTGGQNISVTMTLSVLNFWRCPLKWIATTNY